LKEKARLGHEETGGKKVIWKKLIKIQKPRENTWGDQRDGVYVVPMSLLVSKKEKYDSVKKWLVGVLGNQGPILGGAITGQTKVKASDTRRG